MGGCLSKCLNRRLCLRNYSRFSRESEEAEAASTEPEEFQPLPGEAPVGLVEEPRGKAPVAHMEQLDPEIIDTNPEEEEPAVNPETVVWIEGPGISGNCLYATETAGPKIKDFIDQQTINPRIQYEQNEPVKDFIDDSLTAICKLSPEALFEDRRKLIEFLKYKSGLDSPMALSRLENEQLPPSLVNLTDSWNMVSKTILHQPEIRDKIFGFLHGASDIVAKGCLIATVSDMPENYKRISSHWKSGDNLEKQLKQCIESKIKSQFTGTIDVSHMNEAEGLLGDLVNLTPIYVIGKVENLLDGSSGKGFLMFTTPLEIDAKKLKKVDTNRLLSAIDQRGKTVIPEIREMLTLKEVLDQPRNIPIRLSETPSNTNTPTTLFNPAIAVLPIPTRLQYKDSQTTPNLTFCVYFTKEGKLLYSGRNYSISGLSFTPKIPTAGNRRNLSIYEHNHRLYIFQSHDDEHNQRVFCVHKINLSDGSIEENNIKFQASDSSWFSQHLVVNDEFIIISDFLAKYVRVYSSKDSAHLFNIFHECVSEGPWGVGLLGDSLVVGAWSGNQVSNITINETPKVRWTCPGIPQPSGIRVVEIPQMILVASFNTKQIYVLSYQGQKLSTLAVPECSTGIADINSTGISGINDIAVYGKQIAVADKTKEIKFYEITE